MKRVITIATTETVDQNNNSFSLNMQNEILQNYCKKNQKGLVHNFIINHTFDTPLFLKI